MPPRKIKTSLKDATRVLLKNRPRTKTVEVIAKATGIPVGWLRSFSLGTYATSDCDRVQTLYEYLTGRELV